MNAGFTGDVLVELCETLLGKKSYHVHFLMKKILKMQQRTDSVGLVFVGQRNGGMRGKKMMGREGERGNGSEV